MWKEAALFPATASAASFKKTKPKFVKKECAYEYNKVVLKWKKVKGAKKYQVYRAKVKTSGKTGKWKKWATTKKTAIKKKATGDYKYRVRAVKKGKKSKWSAKKRIFAARAKITNAGFEEVTNIIDIWMGKKGTFNFRVLVTNKTKSPMGFLPNGSRVSRQNTVYAINKSTGKVVKKWDADLQTSGIAKKVKPGKTQSIYLSADATSETDKKYTDTSKYRFMITSSFYPNPEKEPVNKVMSLAYTKNIKDSAIAGK